MMLKRMGISASHTTELVEAFAMLYCHETLQPLQNTDWGRKIPLIPASKLLFVLARRDGSRDPSIIFLSLSNLSTIDETSEG